MYFLGEGNIHLYCAGGSLENSSGGSRSLSLGSLDSLTAHYTQNAYNEISQGILNNALNAGNEDDDEDEVYAAQQELIEKKEQEIKELRNSNKNLTDMQEKQTKAIKILKKDIDAYEKTVEGDSSMLIVLIAEYKEKLNGISDEKEKTGILAKINRYEKFLNGVKGGEDSNQTEAIFALRKELSEKIEELAGLTKDLFFQNEALYRGNVAAEEEGGYKGIIDLYQQEKEQSLLKKACIRALEQLNTIQNNYFVLDH